MSIPIRSNFWWDMILIDVFLLGAGVALHRISLGRFRSGFAIACVVSVGALAVGLIRGTGAIDLTIWVVFAVAMVAATIWTNVTSPRRAAPEQLRGDDVDG